MRRTIRHFAHCYSLVSRYIRAVNRLTRQEQLVLCIVLGLLLTGWAVRAYRTAHPAPATESQDSSPGRNQPTVPGEQAER